MHMLNKSARKWSFSEVGMEVTFATKQKIITLGNHVIKEGSLFIMFCFAKLRSC